MGPSFRGSATSADPSFRGPSTRVGPNDACPGLRWHLDRRLFRDGEGVACLIGHVTLSPSFLALLLSCAHLCYFCLLMMLKGVRACRCVALRCCDMFASLVCVCVSACARACVLLCFVFGVVAVLASQCSFPAQLSSSVRMQRPCGLNVECCELSCFGCDALVCIGVS